MNKIFKFLSKSFKEEKIDLNSISTASKDRLNDSALINITNERKILFSKNELSSNFYLLLKGQVQFSNFQRTNKYNIVTSKLAFMPLGISSLNSPGRYSSEVTIEKKSKYISFSIPKFFDLIYYDPFLGAKLFAFLVARSSELIWLFRGFKGKPETSKTTNIGISFKSGVPHKSDKNTLNRIKESPFFSQFDTVSIKKLLECTEMRLFSKGDIITFENEKSEGLYILFSGRVEASFTSSIGKKIRQISRTIVRPGVALSCANGYSDIPYPYTIIATRDTILLKIPQNSIRLIVESDFSLAASLFQRQIWQIEFYQQTATGLTYMMEKDETELLSNLLQHNASKIPVNSKLYGAVHAIKNRFTRGHALDCIYNSLLKGNATERSVAGLVLDKLEGIKREHKFFGQLKGIV